MEVRFQVPIARQQVVQIAVQKAVTPDLLEQRVQKKPGVLNVPHIGRGIQQPQHGDFVVVKKLVDQGVFGRVVVVQVARTDAQLSRDQRGRDVGFTIPVEQLQRDLCNALGGAAGGFFGHVGAPCLSLG